MADDPIETFRLSLMQDALPIGIAIVERARKGGFARLAEAFIDSDDAIEDLRAEGESAAQTLREQLDRVSPGLGNPVVPVEVTVDQTVSPGDQISEDEKLIQILDRIQSRMDELENHLFDESSDNSTIPSGKG